MPPNKKTQRAEIDDFMHIRGSFPQMSFDLGHQGEMTKKMQKSAFPEFMVSC